MTAFRFALDPLLRVRRVELDRVRQRFAESRRAEVAHREGAAAEQRAAGERSRALAKELAAGVPAESARMEMEALDYHDRRAREHEGAAADAAQRSHELRSEVVDAQRRVRGLELLRERAFEAYQRAQARRAQIRLDENAALVRARNESDEPTLVEPGGPST